MYPLSPCTLYLLYPCSLSHKNSTNATSLSPPPPSPGSLHVSGACYNMWWILCDITGEDLWGTWWLSSSLPKLHFYGVCKTNHLCLIPAETRSKWRCRRSHLHGSWQFCTRAFCICHRYTCIHTSSMCTHSDVPRWSVSPLILTGCLLVCRCLHHPRWCGGGDHRWLSGLQHPMHHWCLRDLCWTGVCERVTYCCDCIVLFIYRLQSITCVAFEGKRSNLLQFS